MQVSYGQYRKLLATCRQQSDRRAAYEALYDTYAASLNTYAALYNGVVQREWFEARARGHKTTLEAALFGNNIPTSVVENLISETRAGAVTTRRECAEEELRRDWAAQMDQLLDEGLITAHIVTRRRELRVINTLDDDERLALALKYGGYAASDEEAQRLIAVLRRHIAGSAGTGPEARSRDGAGGGGIPASRGSCSHPVTCGRRRSGYTRISCRRHAARSGPRSGATGRRVPCLCGRPSSSERRSPEESP